MASHDQLQLRTILATMLKEEWRMHSSLFGTRRFALFPVLIAAATAGAITALSVTGLSIDPVLTAMVALVFVFGLQTGSIVFIGEDALENLLGETTFLVYSARTLPTSEKRLLAAFIVKDALYYAGVFMLPIAAGFLPATLGSDLGVPLLYVWGSLTGMFLFGMVLTIAVLSLRTHLPTSILVGTLGAGVTGLLMVFGPGMVEWTPYGLLSADGALAALKATVVLPVLSGIGLALYNPDYERDTRTASNQFKPLVDRLRGPHSELVAKSLLDVHRSSGGFLKVMFSAGILTVVTGYLTQLAGRIITGTPSPALAFGTLLGITAFPVYNWITQLDSPEDYLYLPTNIGDVFAAKRRAFAIITAPIASIYYLTALSVYPDSITNTVVGFILLAGLNLYFLGVTNYLAGFRPNEFLFDTVEFLKFSAFMMIGFFPPLLVAFFVPTPSPVVQLAASLYAVGVGTLGVWLSGRAPRRWTTRIRY